MAPAEEQEAQRQPPPPVEGTTQEGQPTGDELSDNPQHADLKQVNTPPPRNSDGTTPLVVRVTQTKLVGESARGGGTLLHEDGTIQLQVTLTLQARTPDREEQEDNTKAASHAREQHEILPRSPSFVRAGPRSAKGDLKNKMIAKQELNECCIDRLQSYKYSSFLGVALVRRRSCSCQAGTSVPRLDPATCLVPVWRVILRDGVVMNARRSVMQKMQILALTGSEVPTPAVCRWGHRPRAQVGGFRCVPPACRFASKLKSGKRQGSHLVPARPGIKQADICFRKPESPMAGGELNGVGRFEELGNVLWLPTRSVTLPWLCILAV